MKSRKILNILFIFIIVGYLITFNKSNIDMSFLSDSLFYAKENYKNVNMIAKNRDLKSFNCISVEVDISNIEIIPGDKYKIELEYREDENEVNYEVEEKILKIKQKKDERDFKTEIGRSKKEFRGYIKIYIPKNKTIEDLSIDSYISDLKIKQIKINNIEIDCQLGDIFLDKIFIKDKLDIEDEMGNVNLSESKVEKINSRIGTGDFNIINSKLNTVNIYSDTGDIFLDNIDINSKLYIICKMGNINIKGKTLGNTCIKSECGDVNLKVKGFKDSYNYNVSCNLGELKFGGKKYTRGIIINNNKKHNIDIACNIGSVKVDFLDTPNKNK